MTNTLLIETFTEELPPKALARLGKTFADGVFTGLKSRQLLNPESTYEWFATPRRLAVAVSQVLAKSPEKPKRVKVLPVNVAMDTQANPSEALGKKLAALGFPQLTLADLERAPDGKTESFFLHYTAPGAELRHELQAVLNEAIAALPIPKVMCYQTAGGENVEFVRPAHGLVALYGSAIVPVHVLGCDAGRLTHGHRFQGAADVTLDHADDYEARLGEQGGVMASFDKRRADIVKQLTAQATALHAELGLDERAELLAEVTALVELPTVYVGEFEPEFLEVPQECLILTMQQNQKYFPLFDVAGRLMNKFLLVSNMRLDDARNIIEGNQRVVRPRLADARFFFEQDKKIPLADRVPQLANIVYHNKLGSQLLRVERLRQLAGAIALLLGADEQHARRAAWLAKADLVTNMVGEFPELQGIMGRYYARHDGEEEAVTEAIEAHYRPRFAGDQLPAPGVSTAVALADKLSTLAGIFGAGQAPTGDKDPFALRRAALGVLRILIEQRLDLDLNVLVDLSFASLSEVGLAEHAQRDLKLFLNERLRGYLREQAYTALEVESVLCNVPSRLANLPAQLAAVKAFMQLPEAESLVAANKRVANILRKSAEGGDAFGGVRPEHLAEAAERTLYEALRTITPQASKLFASGDFSGYLRSFAGLKLPVDAFFDSVMVMADDTTLRANRLALLEELRGAMNRVADISKLAA